MNQTAHSKEKVWLDILEMIRQKKIISTTRGNASAKLLKIEGNTIFLEFEHRGQTKVAAIKRSDFEQAMDVIAEKGKVRQTDISNTDKRYVLGAMKELPYFDIVKLSTPDKLTPVPHIVWK